MQMSNCKEKFGSIYSLIIGFLFASFILITPLFGNNNPPQLVVYIVVDQMREDIFDRFENLFQGGLKYLQGNGVYFSEAHHTHAYPATGPGHFVLATGLHPGKEGIIGNNWYDKKTDNSVYCVGDDQTKPLSGNSKSVSYRNIKSPALGDWMKKADRRSKVFSIAGKDRAAVFMGGKKPDGTFWFDFDIGEYVTTDYYMKKYPQWLEQFNEAKYIDKFIGSYWTRLLNDETVYLENSRVDDFPNEIIMKGENKPVFPHYFPEPENGQSPDYQRLWQLPWLPETSLELAKVIITDEQLGKDSHPDLLSIGFSIVDAIGHDYGPFSQEVMDMFLRLDRLLGLFFEFLDSNIGLENILIVLSSDHGSAMIPEYAKRLGLDAGRFGQRYRDLKDELNKICEEQWGKGNYIDRFSNASVYYNYSTLTSKGISLDEMDSLIIPLLLQEQWVKKVYTRSELVNNADLDYEGQLWRNQFHSQRSGDLFFVFKENWVHRGSFGTGHGTTHSYDTHVPLIFAGYGLNPQIIEYQVETVDVAPTIANLLRIEYPDGVDGKVLELGFLSKDLLSK